MRLFRRKKNNRGFSLVEVVCAVAILGLTSTAIGTTMVVSNQNYQRGNAEVDVQKEAQTTTNLIGNLIVDSASVEHKYYKDTTTIEKMTIKGENKEYEIFYDNKTGTITYKEKVMVDGKLQESTGTLATDVSDFRGDFSNYKEDGTKNVSLELAVNKNDRNYEATYGTTSRNGVAKNLGAKKAARITCESEIILEPGQTSFKLPITVHGMNADDANITWSNLSVAEADSNVGTSTVSGDEEGATFNIDKNAKGVLQVTVKTNIEPVTDLTVNDTKTILVKIRRVNNVNILGVRKEGQPAKQNAVYRVTATAAGTSLSKAIGKYYDDGSVNADYEYKNPNYMDFSFAMSNGANVNEYVQVLSKEAVENTDAPYVEFKLLKSIPTGSKLTVTATSKHAKDGTYNKSKAPYATVSNDYVIESKEGVITFPSGLERGQDCVFFDTKIPVQTINQKYSALGGEATWLWSYKKTTDSAWTQFYKTSENGITQKINASESYLFDVNEAYDYRIMFAMIDWKNNKLLWPQDPTLLEPGYGFSEYGLKKGWDWDVNDENMKKYYDPSSSDYSTYCGELQIGAAEIGFTAIGSSITSGDLKNLPSEPDKYSTTAGTSSNPLILKVSNSGSDSMEINYDFANLYRSAYNVRLEFEKYDGHGSYSDCKAIFSDKVFAGNTKISLNNIQNSKVNDQIPYGDYRIKISLEGEFLAEFTEGSSIRSASVTKSDEKWKLYGEKLVEQEDGKETKIEYGYVYFKLVEP